MLRSSYWDSRGSRCLTAKKRFADPANHVWKAIRSDADAPKSAYTTEAKADGTRASIGSITFYSKLVVGGDGFSAEMPIQQTLIMLILGCIKTS